MKCKICGKEVKQKTNNSKDKDNQYCEDCLKEFGW